MPYDRFDRDHRDYDFDRPRSSRRGFGDDRGWDRDDRFASRGPDRRDQDRGWFERAGDEIASWFGDDDRDSRTRREYGRGDHRHGRFAHEDRGFSGGSPRSHRDDPHYQEWRRQRLDELDRDYDEYRRETHSRFERDFGEWREKRQSKRSLLGRIREHMEVVGKDGEHVGTIDRVAGDRIILTRSDPDSGGVHHSMSCTDIDSVEGDRVVLDMDAEKARQRWRDDSRERALFEREDQGEAGPHILDRSFSGTYR